MIRLSDEAKDKLQKALSFEVEIDEQIVTDRVDKWSSHSGGLRPASITELVERAYPIIQRNILEQVVEWFEEHNDVEAPGKIYSPFEYFRPYIKHSDWQELKKQAEEKNGTTNGSS